MSPVWTAFASGVVIGVALAVLVALVVVLRRDRVPARPRREVVSLANALTRAESKRLEVPTVKRRQAIPRVEPEP